MLRGTPALGESCDGSPGRCLPLAVWSENLWV